MSKVFQKQMGKDLSLEKIKVSNQNLSICRTTSTILMLNQDNDFITLWGDLMKDGSVPIKIIFELFNLYWFMLTITPLVVKIFCNSTLLGQVLVETKFCSSYLKAKLTANCLRFPFLFRFCVLLIIQFRLLHFYVLLKLFLYFHGV